MRRPIQVEMPYQAPFKYFYGVAKERFSILLDSSRKHDSLGRYSFIGIDPALTLIYKDDVLWINNKKVNKTVFEWLKEWVVNHQCENIPNTSPFQGGWMGLFGYDLNRQFESIPYPKYAHNPYYDCALGYYDVVLSFDNLKKQAWLFSNGIPIEDPIKREKHAQNRLQACLEKLKPIVPYSPSNETINERLIRSPFNKASYSRKVQRLIDYILAGDIFEGTMSQRFEGPLPNLHPIALYERLRRFNPAPFSAYLNLGDQWILSASPERFIQLKNRQIETRPIKGTIPRSLDIAQDKANAQMLSNSVKDRAENVMIVDLMRNDLSKVCEPHSVKVPQLCKIESFETVHHLVSVVTGTLKKELNCIDLLQATFPGGSITGAPKVRAMELIAELEPTVRGPYCGSMGYIGANGDMDTSIIIRTLLVKDNQVSFQVGSAIVADSSPEAEFEESLAKAAALIKTLIQSE